jgi:zinc transport system substrate-binding protein
MKMMKHLAIPSLIVLVCAVAPKQASGDDARSVVVTTSLLEEAVRAVRPSGENIEIVSILPPSSCPGHFDISPRVLPTIRSSVMLIRHDYQQVLDEKLHQSGVGNVNLVSVSSINSPLIPASYHSIVDQIGARMSLAFPGHCSEIIAATDRVKSLTETLEIRIGEKAVKWNGTPVIAAVHVRDFVEWLGFEVVAVLERAEDTTPRDIERLMHTDAKLIIANLQEGTRIAEMLSDRLLVPYAVLSNFPGIDGYGRGYEDLVEQNVAKVEQAWRNQ